MTIPAVHCEARKVSYRQTKEGLVVAFVIHPNDMPDTLATAPLGQRYMLALAAIGDDEQPIPSADKIAPAADGSGFPAQDHLSSLPPAERPGVEPSSPTARARASERYANLPPMKQASEDAGMLARDERFQAWACEQDYRSYGPPTEGNAAQYVRDCCCNGLTRKLIATDPEAYRKFLALETMFRLAVGELPEIRS